MQQFRVDIFCVAHTIKSWVMPTQSFFITCEHRIHSSVIRLKTRQNYITKLLNKKSFSTQTWTLLEGCSRTILLNSKRGIYVYKAVQSQTNLCKNIRRNILSIPRINILAARNAYLKVGSFFFFNAKPWTNSIKILTFPCLDILEMNHLSFLLHIRATNPVHCIFSWYSDGQTNGVCYGDKMVYLE